MKKYVIPTLVFISSLGLQEHLQAQVDPLDQIIFRQLVPNLIDYDSVSVSTDTVSFQAALESTASMDYHFQDNTKIDTATLTQFGMTSLAYSGEMTDYGAVLAGFAPGMPDTVVKHKAYYNQQGRDSVLEFYASNGTQLTLQLLLHYEHDASGQIDSLVIEADVMGTGEPDTFVVFSMHRSGQMLDSLRQFLKPPGMPSVLAGVYYYQYDSNNHPVKANIVADTSSMLSGQFAPIGEIRFKNNAQGEVVEVHELMIDENTAQLELDQAVRFDVKTNSSIGLPEKLVGRLSLYPNPAENFLKIEGLKEKTHYRILSPAGQMLQEGETNGSGINIESLPTGQYLLQLLANGTHTDLRFSKAR